MIDLLLAPFRLIRFLIEAIAKVLSDDADQIH